MPLCKGIRNPDRAMEGELEMNFRIKTAFMVGITVLAIMLCNAAFDFSCIDGIILYFLIYATQEINRINDRLDKMEGENR